MRKVNRVAGGLVISGIGFVALAALLDFTNAASWLGWLFLAMGIGLLFVGRHYYFRLPVVMPKEPQRQASPWPFASFVAAHRRELSALAQIGLAVSLFRLVGLFFGSNWPSGWGTWLLGLGWLPLFFMSPKRWPRPLPKWSVAVQKIWAGGLQILFVLLVLTYVNSQPWPPSEQYRGILATGLFVLLYGRAAVEFARGEIHPVNVRSAE
ncbi:MAG TPA: hypothetical protein VMU80_28245 [Bryobacteraceae bacterium]|nr:hypothetical protein [Bryobacteraceae bacterium]